MFCSAAEGDLLIQLRAYGAKPVKLRDVSRLFEEQLNHLKPSGESA
jgi:hypothetical protein